MKTIRSGILLLLLGLTSAPAFATLPDFGGMTDQTDASFLDADAAFQLHSRFTAGKGYSFNWSIAEGYYLYRNRVHLQVNGKEVPTGFDQQPDIKNDPSFGRVEVFHHQVATTLNAAAGETVIVQYQGCADAGLCYPPETRRIHLEGDRVIIEKTGAQAVVAVPAPAAPAPSVIEKNTPSLEDSQGISAFLGSAGLPMVLLTFFLLGLGLTFTPCVFPMLPILTGIIAGDKQTLTARRGFALSFAYVTGMSLSYALLGMAIGYFGARANIQTWLQTPAVLLVFAGVFVALAFSMFGFYELQLPSWLRDRLNTVSQRQQGGTLWSTGLMGAVSALVVSPCVSAPLAGTLVYISSTGDAMLGAAALFLLGMGMGAPLVVVGVSGGKLLPRAGQWMVAVKTVFGVGLLGVAVWLLSRIIPGPATLLLWALLLAGSAIYMGALEPAGWGWPRLWKTVGILMLLYSMLLLIGSVTRQDDPFQPLAGLMIGANSSTAAHPDEHAALFTRVKTLRELDAVLSRAQAAGKPVALDLYADWCIACKAMEREVFPAPSVRNGLAAFTTVQLDLTDNTPEHRALLDKYQVFGPPALLFFNPQSQWLSQQTLQGEPTVSLLTRTLESVKRQL